MCKLNKYFSAKHRNCLKNLFLNLSFQSNLNKAIWFSNCPWQNFV